MSTKNRTKKNTMPPSPYFRIKSRDGKETGVAQIVALKDNSTPSDWDAKLNGNDPNDFEILERCKALWALGRADEGIALMYDYASKNGKLVKRTCDFVRI